MLTLQVLLAIVQYTSGKYRSCKYSKKGQILSVLISFTVHKIPCPWIHMKAAVTGSYLNLSEYWINLVQYHWHWLTVALQNFRQEFFSNPEMQGIEPGFSACKEHKQTHGTMLLAAHSENVISDDSSQNMPPSDQCIKTPGYCWLHRHRVEKRL